MIEKEIQFFYGDHDSEVVSLVHPDHMYKTAEYSPELTEFIQGLKERADRTYALVNALSAGEYYGSNRNGDYFPEKSLRDYHKTFEALAGIYKYHINKDPKLSMGKVVFSHYNPEMHRVELILELLNAKADKIISSLNAGEVNFVSMGCFLSGTTVVTSNFSKKSIEDIIVGDDVLTHTGKIRKVTELHHRDYSGKVYTINPVGKYRKEIKATKEHPWLIIEPSKFYTKDKGCRVRQKELTVDDATWKTSEELTGEELLVIPKPVIENEIQVSIDKAKLLGWYLAEGCTHIDDNGVEYSVNVNDQIMHEINDTADGYDKLAVRVTNHNVSKKCKRLTIYDNNFKNECLKYCGKYSHKKTLHKEIFQWNREAKLNFLGAYISGDGFYHEGQAYISSCNKQLLEQIQWLGFSLGLNSTIGRNNHKAGSGFSKEDTTEWILRFRKTANTVLSNYCNKIPNEESNGSGGKGGPYEYDQFYLLKIESIESNYYTGPVYNFEVEEDNSYIVENYAVHNCRVPYDVCSVCGNRAKTRAQYCDHLRSSMGKILSSGKKVYAINTQPKFFDLSIVKVPADPTASFLKVFSFKKEAMASVELDFNQLGQIDNKLDLFVNTKLAEMHSQADIKKVIPAKVDAVSQDPKQLILQSQKRLTNDQITKLSEYPFNEVLSTFLGLRILPVREDFQKLALRCSGYHSEADDLEKAGFLFSVFPETRGAELDISLNNFSEKVAEVVGDDAYYMSLVKPLVISRILEKVANTDPFYPNDQSQYYQKPVIFPGEVEERSFIKKFLFSKKKEPRKSPYKAPIVPLGLLGALYVGYAKTLGKPATVKNVSQFRNFMLRYPWLAPVFVAATGSLASLTAQKATFGDSPVFEPTFQKTSGAIDRYVLSTMLAAPVSYYTSAVAEEKAQRGIPLSSIENAIRKHPMFFSIAGGLAGGATAGTTGTTLRKYLDKGKKFFKLSSFISKLPSDQLDDIWELIISN